MINLFNPHALAESPPCDALGTQHCAPPDCGCGQRKPGSAVPSVAGTVQEVTILQGASCRMSVASKFFPFYAIPCHSLQDVSECLHTLSLSLKTKVNKPH